MNPLALKNRLQRTWGAFFGRHGNFTPIQIVSIPLILDGENVVLCSETASGKTDAVLAPLIERYLPPVHDPGLTILYLLPTRALINDLFARLDSPLDILRVSHAVKTRDLDAFDPKHPADVLLTTPESLDSLLASEPKALINVRAVVIDELHVFDGTVRGDQLRVLLNRLRQVRAHAARTGDTPDEKVQYAALSATLPEPGITSARYFSDARLVQIPTQRAIQLEKIALDADSPGALLDYLNTFRQRGWRKALVFCNTRAEVEAYATAVRAAGSPFGEAVFVHYSNFAPEHRREIEGRFAHTSTALCFASSTLELGIDIGDIDVTVLIGAPGNAAAFMQRIGRANRRQQVTRVACFYRTALENLLFDALQVTPANPGEMAFRPSVAVQQIFSLLKQSPSGAVRLNTLIDLFAGMLDADDIRSILGELQASGYLQTGRAGEWRSSARLNQLVDIQSTDNNPLSLFSNIQMDNSVTIKIRDYHTQELVASVNQQWFDRDVLTLEGRAMRVTWVDGDTLWVSADHNADQTDRLHYRSARQMLSHELAKQLPAQIGLSPGAAPLIPFEDRWLCFHWLGDIYGHALLDLIRYTLAAEKTTQPGLCVSLPEEILHLPTWTPEQVTRYVRDNYRRYESLLTLGAYHHLLPLELRCRAVVEQFNVPRFLQTLKMLHIERASATCTTDLETYLY